MLNYKCSELPGGPHHEVKVRIVVNGRTDPTVVVHELLLGDLQGGRGGEEKGGRGREREMECGVPRIMTHLSIWVIWRIKALQELSIGLFIGPFPILNLGMLLRVVHSTPHTNTHTHRGGNKC